MLDQYLNMENGETKPTKNWGNYVNIPYLVLDIKSSSGGARKSSENGSTSHAQEI
jgi:hypothetical protein